MNWFLDFLYSQLLVTLPKPTKDFTGQTIIVTGSNTGLGLEAVRHFSRLNATLVIIAVRNLSKGAAAKQNILQSTNRDLDSIEVWELDLLSFDSVKAFVARANQLPRIDGILENAGIMTKNFKLAEGFESTITTNVISTFLLALLILPKLRESASRFNIQPRLTVVTSDLHFIAKREELHEDDIFKALNFQKQGEMSMNRYMVSKLLQVLAVRELGAALYGMKSKSTQIIINCLTPGACRSDFNRESTGIGGLAQYIMSYVIGRSTEAGSRTLVAGISAGEESNGCYMANCYVAETSSWVLSADGQKTQKKFWNQLLQQLEVIEPGLSNNLKS